MGYLAGFGKDHLEDVGGLGTAQRNTAAGVIVAIQNFSDPNVFVMLTLANIVGIIMLLVLARSLSRDNKVKLEALCGFAVRCAAAALPRRQAEIIEGATPRNGFS